MQESGGIFFVKKGWTILVAVASSDFWIVIVVVMVTYLENGFSVCVVTDRFAHRRSETTAREDVCGKVSERGHRLHSLSPLLFSDGIETTIKFVSASFRIPNCVRVGYKQDNRHDQNESV